MKGLNPSDAGIDSLIYWIFVIHQAHHRSLNPSDAGIDSLICICILYTTFCSVLILLMLELTL